MNICAYMHIEADNLLLHSKKTVHLESLNRKILLSVLGGSSTWRGGGRGGWGVRVHILNAIAHSNSLSVVFC